MQFTDTDPFFSVGALIDKIDGHIKVCKHKIDTHDKTVLDTKKILAEIQEENRSLRQDILEMKSKIINGLK
jgi:hypothetical protein